MLIFFVLKDDIFLLVSIKILFGMKPMKKNKNFCANQNPGSITAVEHVLQGKLFFLYGVLNLIIHILAFFVLFRVNFKKIEKYLPNYFVRIILKIYIFHFLVRIFEFLFLIINIQIKETCFKIW